MRILPMQVDEPRTELGQLRERRRPAVDPCAASSLRVDHAPQQHLVGGGKLLLGEPRACGRRIGQVELGGELGTFRAGAKLP